jgi:hypothetical protein
MGAGGIDEERVFSRRGVTPGGVPGETGCSSGRIRVI